MKRISINTGTAPYIYGADKCFQMLREAGFDGVDLGMDSNILSYSDVVKGRIDCLYARSDEEIIEHFRPFKEAAEKYGIAFVQAHAPFPSWVIGQPVTNEFMFRVFEKCLMVCHYLNCPYLIVHPFFPGYGETLTAEAEWKLNIESYSRLIPFIKKYGVTVCLENMFTVHKNKIYASVCQEPEEVIRYIDTLNEVAGEKCFAFCLDTGHSLLIGKDMLRLIKQLGHRIEALHIQDNDAWNDQHFAPFMGRMDWSRVVQGLREVGYKGDINMEAFNALATFDRELAPELLKLMAASARLLARRIDS